MADLTVVKNDGPKRQPTYDEGFKQGRQDADTGAEVPGYLDLLGDDFKAGYYDGRYRSRGEEPPEGAPGPGHFRDDTDADPPNVITLPVTIPDPGDPNAKSLDESRRIAEAADSPQGFPPSATEDDPGPREHPLEGHGRLTRQAEDAIMGHVYPSSDGSGDQVGSTADDLPSDTLGRLRAFVRAYDALYGVEEGGVPFDAAVYHSTRVQLRHLREALTDTDMGS